MAPLIIIKAGGKLFSIIIFIVIILASLQPEVAEQLGTVDYRQAAEESEKGKETRYVRPREHEMSVSHDH